MSTGRWRRTAVGVALAGAGLSGCTSATSTLHLRIAPVRALLDAPITLEVRGAQAGDKVTISTSGADAKGVAWKSSATFTATAGGTVSTAQQPTSGPYHTANPMGLFQDQTPHGGDPAGSGQFIIARTGWKIAVTASDGDAHTTTTITRLYPEQVGVRSTPLRPATDDGLYGELERPRSDSTRRPAVVVFGGSEGGLDTAFKAKLLAAHGFATLALAYFHEPGLPSRLDRVPIEYFATAVRWLAKQPGVDPHRIAVFGVSRGSEAAQLVAVHYPQLVAGVVLGSPSNLAFGALPADGHSAWTFGGRQVPFASGADSYSADAPDNPAAVIRDGDIHAPILAVCGTDDELWGSCAHVRGIERATAHARHRPTLLSYRGAGHFVGSMLPDIPEYGTDGRDAAGQEYGVGGNQADDEAGRADAWTKLLAFLAALPPASGH